MVLSRLEDDRASLPYLIWYPSIAAKSTNREFYRLRPPMAPQILRACIVGGYYNLLVEILATVEPDEAVAEDTEAVGGFYKDALEQRVRELGGSLKKIKDSELWKIGSVTEMQRAHNTVYKEMDLSTNFEMLYDGIECNGSSIEMQASYTGKVEKLSKQQHRARLFGLATQNRAVAPV